jgi:predicted RNA-binding protein YlqC (UPF0109 family)
MASPFLLIDKKNGKTLENHRIQEVSNKLQRLCRLHEEESGNGKVIGKHGAVSAIPRPRNVLVDKDGDMYVIDAEIAKRS